MHGSMYYVNFESSRYRYFAALPIQVLFKYYVRVELLE